MNIMKQREITDRLAAETEKAFWELSFNNLECKNKILEHIMMARKGRNYNSLENKQLNHQMERSEIAPFSGEQEA